VNDVSGGRSQALLEVVAQHGVHYVLMHTRGEGEVVPANTQYTDVVHDVVAALLTGAERACELGIARERLWIDPGLGFAKRPEHSFAVLAATSRLAALGRPLLVGPSRKSFLTAATGPLPAGDRDWATAAAVTAAVLGGAHIVRVHRVADLVPVVRVADAIHQASA